MNTLRANPGVYGVPDGARQKNPPRGCILRTSYLSADGSFFYHPQVGVIPPLRALEDSSCDMIYDLKSPACGGVDVADVNHRRHGEMITRGPR